MKVLILTPIDEEYNAVVRHLSNSTAIFDEDAYYLKGLFKGQHHTYEVLVRQPGAKVAVMTSAAERALQFFQPDIAMIVGIAGGLKDTQIGDLLIATKAYGYESGKESDSGFQSRPEVISFSTHLLARAQALSKSDTWKLRCLTSPDKARVYFGPIAAGDKLMASTDNITYQRLKTHYNDSLAIEMEAIGFAQALQGRRNIHGLVIRGISDLCVNKSVTDAEGNQPLAADRAAAFGFELLWQLDCSSFLKKQNNMDAKTLVQEIYSILFPLPESFKEIGNDFTEAINGDVRSIWQKIKPLFIKDVEKLVKDPHDKDRQIALKMKLEDELSENDSLRFELEKLVGPILASQNKKEGTSIAVKGGTNVIAGNNIHVGGNLTQISTKMEHHGSGDNVAGNKIIQNRDE